MFILIIYYLIIYVGEASPSLHPCLRQVLRYPLLGVPGETLSFQLPPSGRAHPQTSLFMKKLSEFFYKFFTFS
jgi:hypothetical protein